MSGSAMLIISALIFFNRKELQEWLKEIAREVGK